MSDRTYIAIDLKSFYASVECMDRQLDPMTTNLVVADESRTEKTICLAVSPSLKSHKIPGRARLFEVVQRVREVNAERRQKAPGRRFSGKSVNGPELQANPTLELDYIVAVPRMARYMEVSAKIYSVYLKYVSPEDIHVYSIDEVFIDATSYLKLYKLTAHDFAMRMIRDVLQTTGITATAGIGPNLFLCKIAMDIEAKHIQADKDGVRIAELNERSFREKMWDHRPLTDFWRVGRGYATRLEAAGMYTLGDVARVSVKNEDILYRMFGINAELLIDHAWGWEPCTIADIKSYRPENNSVSSGQVLQEPYEHDKARLVVREMADLLALDLVEKRLVTDQLVLTIAYDVMNLSDPERRRRGNWLQFIETQQYIAAATDFAHVELATPYGLERRHLLFFMDIGTREVRCGGIVHNPDSNWTTQIARNMCDMWDGFLLGKKYLIHDRDTLFNQRFDSIFESIGITIKRLPPFCPMMNSRCENFIRALKSECLDKIIFSTREQIRLAVTEFLEYWNHYRVHEGIGGKMISPYPQDPDGEVVEVSFLGGLLHGYMREKKAA